MADPHDYLLAAEEEATASASVTYERPALQTAYRSLAIRRWKNTIAGIRDESELLNNDVSDVHRAVESFDLDERAALKARREAKTLLRELGTERGMSWTAIARLTGVSASAVRKWRGDGSPSGDKRLALARLCAFLDLLEDFPIEDAAGWMEMRLLDGYTVTPMELYEASREDLLLEFAGGRCSTNRMLDEFDPDWRSRYSSDYDIVDAGDGNRSIRRR